MPVAVVFGVITALAVHWYVVNEGMTGDDSAPLLLWWWTGLTGAAVVVAVLGWRGTRWWRRAASLTAVPLCLICALLILNVWLGYARTVQSAWNLFSVVPLPNQADMAAVTAMAEKGVIPHRGRIVPVTISPDMSHFKHRGEYVYLPPAWFTSIPAPRLPVIMMIGGEFGTPADWLWAGDAQDTLDDFELSHGGNAPIVVFVDKGGAFNKDTECVNGPRGNAADYLTKDVVPFLVSQFGVSPDPANWGVVGWSMGGTCALDLTVMHPELFSTFVDIGGDGTPNAGTWQQTKDRLFGGDIAAWVAFDPASVIARHGPYTGVSGVFALESPVNPETRDKRATATRAVSAFAGAFGIDCAVVEYPGKHDWPFGANSFQQTLPWLAGQLGTPGVPRSAMPRSAPPPDDDPPPSLAAGWWHPPAR